jgi:hypothetical protein
MARFLTRSGADARAKREGTGSVDEQQRRQDLGKAEGGEEEEKDNTASCSILL